MGTGGRDPSLPSFEGGLICGQPQWPFCSVVLLKAQPTESVAAHPPCYTGAPGGGREAGGCQSPSPAATPGCWGRRSEGQAVLRQLLSRSSFSCPFPETSPAPARQACCGIHFPSFPLPVGDYAKALECARSFLLFHPEDEDVLDNESYYESLLEEESVDLESIKPREVRIWLADGVLCGAAVLCLGLGSGAQQSTDDTEHLHGMPRPLCACFPTHVHSGWWGQSVALGFPPLPCPTPMCNQ